MSETEKDSWGEYSKLVLKELERLNDSYEKMRSDIDTKFMEVNTKLTEIRAVEKSVINQSVWIDKVNDVWSPTQQQQAKDEIYRQKGKWISAIAVITVVQMLVGIGITIWVKLH